MLYGLYLSAAGMQAQDYRTSVTANNLANAQTTGFKRDIANVQARRNAAYEDPTLAAYRMPVLGREGGGVFAMPTAIDLRPAAVQKTNNELNAALEGDGFFLVQGESGGHPMMTRDGSFARNQDNLLVTAATGRPVLTADLQPVKLDPGLPVAIDTHGTVRQGDQTVGQLAVMTARPGDLVKVGGNLLTTREGAKMTPATVATKVRQGYLENSGVDPINEMINMMEGQRAFEANAKMVQYQDQTLQEVIAVGRIA